jgi:hypothetical protein
MIALPRSAFLSLALIAVLLAACGAPREPAREAHMSWYDKYPDWKPGDPMPDEASAAKPATPKPADAPPPASPPPQRQAALPPAREPLGREPAEREPPPEPPKLEELRGLDAAQLMQLLGKPTLLRDEATAQMWQYRGEACVLHLFLYPGPGATGEKRVQYVEARPRQTGAPAATSGPNECLATLVGARRLRS